MARATEYLVCRGALSSGQLSRVESYISEVLNASVPATNNTGRNTHMGSVQASTFDFDNVLARAAYSEETTVQRVQRQQASASSQLQHVDASLREQGSHATSNGANGGARSSQDDQLRGIGAQFDTDAGGLG
ncbi:hypothetical protein VMCG_03894 [Cytospora schulzeri]|uniref:Uncharacterized protein n=1 Tax=Cytospora schulzeri TaxID=448051 RepID=A0A423WV47_9PEZI|nr:hypothetical protein VMCG_03894 [Valsa malicola]